MRAMGVRRVVRVHDEGEGDSMSNHAPNCPKKVIFWWLFSKKKSHKWKPPMVTGGGSCLIGEVPTRAPRPILCHLAI